VAIQTSSAILTAAPRLAGEPVELRSMRREVAAGFMLG